jgi:hypothetical protein
MLTVLYMKLKKERLTSVTDAVDVDGVPLVVNLLGALVQRLLGDAGRQAADLLHIVVAQVGGEEVASVDLLDIALAALCSTDATGDSAGHNTAKNTDQNLGDCCGTDLGEGKESSRAHEDSLGEVHSGKK